MSDETGVDAEIGRVVAGRYEIVRKLGEGGMGAVYQAKQISMDRMVALKLIRADVAGRSDSAQRFHREMKMTSKVNHENTIQVYDYGEDAGQLFLAMEFLDGKPLTKIITGPLEAGRIAYIGAQIARALAAAHAETIVHRDLKPDNVMLLDRYGQHDFVKVLDFGIARFFEGERTNLTADGALVGTPVYMSPEQAGGRTIDHRSDIYSLGCMLYQMAAGRVPFESTTLTGLLVMHLQEPPQPITALRPDLPPALAELIMQMLEKAPEARPQTATEVATRLGSLSGGQAPVIPSTRIQPRDGAASAGGSKTGLVVMLAGVVLAGGGVAGFFALKPKAKVDAPPPVVSRAKLDAAYGVDPLPPESCRTQDQKIIARLERALGKTPASDAFDADPIPTSAEYWALAGRAALDAKQGGDKVAGDAQKALEQCPDFALAHYLYGRSEQMGGRIGSAAKAYRAAESAAPTHEWDALRFNLATVSLGLNPPKPKDAIELLDKLIAKNPAFPHAFLVRAQAKNIDNQEEAALKDLDEAVRRNASDEAAAKQIRATIKIKK